METHEEGFCDRCGCELTSPVWLTIDEQELCQECARLALLPVVEVPKGAYSGGE